MFWNRKMKWIAKEPDWRSRGEPELLIRQNGQFNWCLLKLSDDGTHYSPPFPAAQNILTKEDALTWLSHIVKGHSDFSEFSRRPMSDYRMYFDANGLLVKEEGTIIEEPKLIGDSQ